MRSTPIFCCLVITATLGLHHCMIALAEVTRSCIFADLIDMSSVLKLDSQTGKLGLNQPILDKMKEKRQRAPVGFAFTGIEASLLEAAPNMSMSDWHHVIKSLIQPLNPQDSSNSSTSWRLFLSILDTDKWVMPRDSGQFQYPSEAATYSAFNPSVTEYYAQQQAQFFKELGFDFVAIPVATVGNTSGLEDTVASSEQLLARIRGTQLAQTTVILKGSLNPANPTSSSPCEYSEIDYTVLLKRAVTELGVRIVTGFDDTILGLAQVQDKILNISPGFQSLANDVECSTMIQVLSAREYLDAPEISAPAPVFRPRPPSGELQRGYSSRRDSVSVPDQGAGSAVVNPETYSLAETIPLLKNNRLTLPMPKNITFAVIDLFNDPSGVNPLGELMSAVVRQNASGGTVYSATLRNGDISWVDLPTKLLDAVIFWGAENDQTIGKMVHSLDLIRGSSPNVTVHAVAQLSTNSISVKLWDSANAILAVFVEDNPDSRRNSVTHVLSAIMFGDIAPSARLPFTLWRSPFAAHTCYSSYFNPMPRLLNDFKEWFRQSQSEEDQNPARLPFGFGMTYGFFWFSNLTASVNRTHATAVVQVKNKSQTQARISVLLFSAALPRGALRLRRFVKLNPMGYGDEREVRFDVPLAEILEKQEPFHGNEITLRIADLEQRIRIGT